MHEQGVRKAVLLGDRIGANQEAQNSSASSLKATHLRFGLQAASACTTSMLMPLRRNCTDISMNWIKAAVARSAFVLVDVHGVIKIDTCNVDTVTENLYIPRVVDQAGRIVTLARGEVVARLEWPPGVPVLCAPSLLIKSEGHILARPPYIRPRPSRMAANGSTKTLARQPLRAWVHEYSSRRAQRRGKRQPSPRARIYASAGRITGHEGGMQ
jgi:hypothetical protein